MSFTDTTEIIAALQAVPRSRALWRIYGQDNKEPILLYPPERIPEILAAHHFTPLELALFSKASLETVQNIYHDDPSALTAGLLLNLCTHGAKPGVIKYLVTQQPNLVKQVGPEFGIMKRHPFVRSCMMKRMSLLTVALQQGPGENCPFSEDSDILALGQANPTALTRPPSYPEIRISIPVRCLLQWKYSLKLMTEVFRLCAQKYAAQPFSRDKHTLLFDEDIFCPMIRIPPGQRFFVRRSSDPSPLLRTALDIDCITAMWSAGLLEYFNTNKCRKWEPTAFLQLVKYFLGNPKLTVLNMGAFPDPAGPHKEELPSLNDPTYKALSKNCAISTVVLNFSPETNPLAVSFLQDSVALMPQLVNLRLCLSSDGLQIAAPTICHLLAKEDTTLVDLVILITQHHNNNKKLSLQVVLEVLKTNKTLQNFAYRNDQDPALVQTYEDCLVDILKTANATLETAEFRSVQYRSEQLPSKGQLGYYTTLNRHERGLLQKITDWDCFVVILTRAQQEQPNYSDLDRVNITFGLLLENPIMWLKFTSLPVQAPTKMISSHNDDDDTEPEPKKRKLTKNDDSANDWMRAASVHFFG
eukprot:Sro1511_g278720.1 n/a (585) ;mRNA; r:12479-14371